MLSIGRRAVRVTRKLHYFRPDGRAQPLIQTSLFHQSETMVKNSKKSCVSSILCKMRRICGECINFTAIFIRNRLWPNFTKFSFIAPYSFTLKLVVKLSLFNNSESILCSSWSLVFPWMAFYMILYFFIVVFIVVLSSLELFSTFWMIFLHQVLSVFCW